MSIKKRIDLVNESSDESYKYLCELMESQGVLVGCGNPDDKWVAGKWDDEIDFSAWAVATLGLDVDFIDGVSNENA